MSDYPEEIDSFREIENLPGLTYNPEDKRTLFTEDLQAVRDAVIAIETFVGVEGAVTDSPFMNAMLNVLYPIGKILAFSTDIDPNDQFEVGTWELYGLGRTLVGLDPEDPVYDELGAEMGAEEVTLTTTEMPSHGHGGVNTWPSQYPLVKNGNAGGGLYLWASGSVGNDSGIWSSAFNHQHGNAGGGAPHNNMQPSKVVAYWVRVS